MKRLNAIHTKHAPPQVRQDANVVLIKSSTPYISAVKRINKKLNVQPASGKAIIIKGMGKALVKTLSIALHFQELGNHVEVTTGSVEVLDEFKLLENSRAGEVSDGDEQSESDSESIYKKRMVSFVECKIYIK